MTDLQREFQKETKQSFEGIPINGVHLEYIAWLEAKIKTLTIPVVVEQSKQLKCFMEDDKPNCNCKINHCLKNGW